MKCSARTFLLNEPFWTFSTRSTLLYLFLNRNIFCNKLYSLSRDAIESDFKATLTLSNIALMMILAEKRTFHGRTFRFIFLLFQIHRHRKVAEAARGSEKLLNIATKRHFGIVRLILLPLSLPFKHTTTPPICISI